MENLPKWITYPRYQRIARAKMPLHNLTHHSKTNPDSIEQVERRQRKRDCLVAESALSIVCLRAQQSFGAFAEKQLVLGSYSNYHVRRCGRTFLIDVFRCTRH